MSGSGAYAGWVRGPASGTLDEWRTDGVLHEVDCVELVFILFGLLVMIYTVHDPSVGLKGALTDAT